MPWLMENIPAMPCPVLVYLALSVAASLILWLLCTLIQKRLLPLLKKLLISPSEI
jgi:hypothetical protein